MQICAARCLSQLHYYYWRQSYTKSIALIKWKRMRKKREKIKDAAIPSTWWCRAFQIEIRSTTRLSFFLRFQMKKCATPSLSRVLCCGNRQKTVCWIVRSRVRLHCTGTLMMTSLISLSIMKRWPATSYLLRGRKNRIITSLPISFPALEERKKVFDDPAQLLAAAAWYRITGTACSLLYFSFSL